MKITTTLTDLQYKALEYAALDPQEWVDNVVSERARVAKEQIISILFKHCNENEIQIKKGIDAQVEQAFDLGIVKKASTLNKELCE